MCLQGVGFVRTLLYVKHARYIRGEEAAVCARPVKSNRSKAQQTGVQYNLPRYKPPRVQHPSSIPHRTTYTEGESGPHLASINVTAWTDERLVEHCVFFNKRLEEWSRRIAVPNWLLSACHRAYSVVAIQRLTLIFKTEEHKLGQHCMVNSTFPVAIR